MPVRKASAEYKNSLRDGKGTLSTETGALKNLPYTFLSRFEDGRETNPEELLGAAHAGCFSMALANALARGGFTVNSINTEAKVHIEKVEAGFAITKIELETVGDVTGGDEKSFLEHAEKAKAGCPVSKALAGASITLKARMKN
jgi:osmotically inducible protein OsmC